ncbi:MAG: ribose 5-phosphate isomerase B [Acutalibacteraceae bacterium]|nr:ribose 5-phosphate isomerase B [Acutalibacteraceae bacterium]
MSKKIIIGCDHGGFEMKEQLVEFIKQTGNDVDDCGIYEPKSVDYPIIAKKVADKVASGQGELGILICGTGIGMSLAANKVRGIRAAACSEVYSAKFTRLHNNSNILCLGGRVIGIETAKIMVDAFINTEFEGGRHQKRVDMIEQIEKEL